MSEKEPHFTDALKERINKHESRLQTMSQSLVHANTHLKALNDLAERLKVHLEIKKTAAKKDITESEKQEDRINEDKDVDDSLHFSFPATGPSLDVEFLKMVESMVEGIILISTETNMGKLARDLKGPSIQEDLLKWRQMVTVMQKYDDQVRRAIEYFDRQQQQDWEPTLQDQEFCTFLQNSVVYNKLSMCWPDPQEDFILHQVWLRTWVYCSFTTTVHLYKSYCKIVIIS